MIFFAQKQPKLEIERIIVRPDGSIEIIFK
ncbi:hypothetical protein MCORR_v1c01890 [Mesoplasma corruscae]|uniref:Uncharacterized protein n=1 Tax=Mesoplasma corruscae TaxID=216874 RepID=A0A2S5RGY7_9MOLU|nr:hypothetical protein MCORR_v1c01890 [Mesoplasma corruscae]